jgi:hypothetical protein
MIGPWKFTINQMEIETRESLRKAVILGTFHDNALATLSVTYPLLLPLYVRYHPLHLALVAAYNQHTSLGSTQQGNRLSVTQETANIKQKIIISAFGATDYSTHRFLNVVGLSGDVANYRVQLL